MCSEASQNMTDEKAKKVLALIKNDLGAALDYIDNELGYFYSNNTWDEIVRTQTSLRTIWHLLDAVTPEQLRRAPSAAIKEQAHRSFNV